MGEILSQSEIDELLRALNSDPYTVIPEPEVKKVAKDYDFARPSKFSKEHLRALELIFENYARSLSTFITGYLRTASSIAVVGTEQVTYSEFCNSMTNPVVLSILEFSPLKGSLILELSPNLSYAIIDRILGGPGFTLKKLRDFSEIEKILLERVITQMLSFLPEAWANVSEIKPKLSKIETNTQFAQIISPNEMTALITLTAKIGSVEGMMNFCIPHITLETVMDRLNNKFWFHAPDESSPEVTENIEQQLEKAMVTMSAIVGRAYITVDDFINLQSGDIIPLDSFINSDIDIMVGNLHKFHAKPGISRGKNAVQITSLITKEE